MDVKALVSEIAGRHPAQPEFVQAVDHALRDLEPLTEGEERYRRRAILERLLDPDRLIQFRVEWEDDEGRLRVNRGYRVQWSDALGPYKGGLRFHPEVGPSILKFLAFEQTFKNALTGLGIGGAKGGADFDSTTASESEVRRFCQAFMTELHRHVGSERDVPAGDIGVGAREIGYLYGQYKRLRPDAPETFTGKPLELSGSPLREEATGWGVVYFAEQMLARSGESLEGMTCVVSGAGNVATHAADKLIERGARVVTLSDRTGFVHQPRGFRAEDIDWLKHHRSRRGSIAGFAAEHGLEHRPGPPWQVSCDVAFPCATENELDGDDVRTLMDGGCRFVCEGANMPCTAAARARIDDAGLLFGPGKAANAGGVSVSEFEMAQAASRQRWSRDHVDRRLQDVMESIHAECVHHGRRDDAGVDYGAGATRAGFARVAAAMLRF